MAEHEADLISDRTKAALAQVKARGIKLGSPNPKAGNAVAVPILKADADEFAAQVMPHIRELQRLGVTTLRDLAAALESRGIKTRRGESKWHASQVSNILKRA